MTLTERLKLVLRRFSPLEELLIAAVREVLPSEARGIFDAQIAGVTLVQRHSNEIYFYRRVSGKVNWSNVPAFPRSDEFGLAEIKFSVKGKRFKATLTSINGHVFDFAVTPSPKDIAFADWDSAGSARLLNDPMTVKSVKEREPIPNAWRDFLAGARPAGAKEWTLHDAETAFCTAFDDGEFLVLAERDGDQFVLYRIEPPGSGLFYLDSHDGKPELIKGDVREVFRRSGN